MTWLVALEKERKRRKKNNEGFKLKKLVKERNKSKKENEREETKEEGMVNEEAAIYIRRSGGWSKFLIAR